MSRDPAPLRALVLDYGNVLTYAQRQDCVADMAAQLEVPVEAFRGAYWRHRPAYDRGLDGVGYWREVARTLGREARIREPGAIERLIARDLDSWTHYREEAWELASAFRAGGGRTGLLSNSIPELMARLRAERPPERWFDAVVSSCEVRATKPDRQIYDVCLRALAVEPGQVLFVDDRPENVEAAERLGWRGFHFAGDDAMARLRDGLKTAST